MKEETQFAIRVDRRLKSLPDCWFCNIQQVAIRGIPDRIGCINGRFFALELKTGPKAKRAKLQEYVIEKINEAGGFARFVYPENLEHTITEMEALLGHHD